MVNPELWILESVAEHCVPLWTAVHPDGEHFLNKRGHGLDLPTITALLERLSDQGDLFFKDEGDQLRTFSPELLDPTPSRYPCPYYGLTSKGGMRWESWAEADWDRYVGYCSHDGGESPQGEILWSDEIAATRRETLDSFVQIYYPFWGKPAPYQDVRVTQIRPWEATYWKVLPSAWHLKGFRGPEPEPYHSRRNLTLGPKFEELMRWYRKSWE